MQAPPLPLPILKLPKSAAPCFVFRLRYTRGMGVKKFLGPITVELLILTALSANAAEVSWTHISSATGELPVPGKSTQQTGALIADLDKDGTNDFVLSFRQTGPALVWYRRITNGWNRLVIDPDYLTVEAGGVALDIDNDGDLDIVFGGDWQSNQVWWWENPYPNFDPKKPWTRRFIKNSGATQHHDQVIGDFKGTGDPQLVFWNQGAKKLFIADIPKDARSSPKWEYAEIFSGAAGEGTGKYAEGLAAADVDRDGKTDILAGNFWLKHRGGNEFKATRISEIGGRIAIGHFKDGTYPHVVIAPGDGIGPLRWYECKGDPRVTENWVGHDLLPRNMIHGHTLAVGDIDADGNDDIFAAEMAKWTEGRPTPDSPDAEAWIFYGDGKGNFNKTTLAHGIGFHEGRLADLDGDGDLDILDKPYNWEAPRVDVWLNNGTSSNRASIFRGPIGLELFSVRHLMSKSVHEALLAVKGMGFNEVEGGGAPGMTMGQFRRQLDDMGLKCTSMMAGYERLGRDIEGVARDAKLLDSTYVNCSWIPHKGVFTREDAQRAAADFNVWGKALKLHGLQFCYHPHGFEFQPSPEGTLFDFLAQQTDPELVGFEMDVFWVVHPGQDPVQLMRKYPNRFLLMHLKDMRAGTPTGVLTGQAPEDTNVPIGTGMIDYRAVLREAQRIGVKRYYIEDESTDPLTQVPLSLKWLKEVKL
jgi:sugar phosphate isomerase/epimerase